MLGLRSAPAATAARAAAPRVVARVPAGPARSSTVARAGDKLSKADLVAILADEVKLDDKVAKTCVDMIFDVIIEEVQEGNEVTILGFGTFRGRDRAAREGRNPKTGEKLQIPAMRIPGFTAGKTFKEAVKAGPAKKA